MNLATLSVKNAFRNRARMLLTIAGVAVTIFAFVFLRTVLSSWMAAIDEAAKDRLATRHKITFTMPLPKRYMDDLRGVPGVTAATHGSWFGGKDPRNEREFFATIAVDQQTFFNVFDEIIADDAVKQKFKETKNGAVVGDVLAKKLGWSPGQKLTLSSQIYPGDWEFEIVGTYTAARKSVDRSTFWFRWDYLNDSLPPDQREVIGWIISRVDDPTRSAEISRAVDQRFDERDTQTVTMSERAFQTSFLAGFSAILTAIDVVSLVILFIMTLILGNTIAMGARERTNEYGVMRAIGFLPRQVAIYVVGEGLVTGIVGGLVGLGLSYPLIQQGFGRFVEENFGAWFAYFRISFATALAALLFSAALGAVAALLPAVRASRIHVVDALRRVN
jgi:putative ABC transport system permease protein